MLTKEEKEKLHKRVQALIKSAYIVGIQDSGKVNRERLQKEVDFGKRIIEAYLEGLDII